jgi:hypothetical protein
MTERIKLIWDFRGPNAGPIAKHHVKHLQEFVAFEALQNTICLSEEINPSHHIAVLVAEKTYMNELRERLKPHRGQLYSEK